MARLGRWCFEHRKRVVAVWLLAIVVITGVSVAVGSSFNSNLSLPGSDSQAAVTLLTQNFPAASGEGDQIVIQAAHGTTISPLGCSRGDRGAGQDGQGARHSDRGQPVRRTGRHR